MKTTKIIIITFLATFVLSIGFSTKAALICISDGCKIIAPSIPSKQLSEAEQIAKGYTYNIYTGQKFNIPSTTTNPSNTITTVTSTQNTNSNLSATELRFQAIEARLNKLEKAIQ